MRYIIDLAILCFAVSLSGCAIHDPVSLDKLTSPEDSLADRGWILVWSDDFDGDTLDRTKWAPEVSCWGGGNAERQCYVDRLENVRVEDGYLRLKAAPGEHSGPSVHMEHSDYPGDTVTQPYTSGKVRTRDLAFWTYGRIEGRMKLPTGQGAWPAFWMMPQYSVHGGWPLSGEIDIMEAVNLGAPCNECEGGTIENRSSGAIHFGKRSPDNRHVDKRRALTAQPGQAGPPREQFHIYAMEWGEGRIDWFVDNERFYSVASDNWFTDSITKAEDPNAPFNEDFYVMLNFAVGGRWPEGANAGGIDAGTFPAEMIVDYVKVYQCAADPDRGRACMAAG